MNDNCRGCLRLTTDKVECRYTKFGVEYLPNCPCQTCLIKLVCGNTCDDFAEAHTCYKYAKIMLWDSINLKEYKIL